jgi:arylsulfatase A-like enzyme
LDRLLDEADLSNTLVIYLSDNGFMLGAHRITGKDVPYARSTEVPMYARWDGVIDSGVSTGRVTPQIDLTAMVADAARLEWSMEGINPLTEGRSGSPLEAIQGSGRGGRHPAYCGWRSKRYLFVEYTNDRGAELYDYRRDPDELRNAIDSPQYRDVVRQHRQLAKQSCSPVPPGFSWR